MKNVKIHHVFLTLIGAIAVFIVLSLFVPNDGFKIAGITFNYPTFDTILNPVLQENADIDSLFTDIDTTIMDLNKDLVQHSRTSNGKMGIASGGELSVNNSSSIYLNELATSSLHSFFQKLKTAAGSGQKIHILHYGDSQIEGDRMTGFIRERIQTQFGGNGPGLVPAMNVYSTYAFNQSYSPNFRRYTCFGGDKLKNKKYGAMASAARFTAENSDTSEFSGLEKIGWIELQASGNAYGRARSFSNVKMYYNSCFKPCAINVYENGVIIHQDSLINDGKHHIFKLNFPRTPGKLRFELKASTSPTISNFSLEGDVGVQVSNIGMRGSSGTVFGAMDRGILGQMLNELSTELVILQFGGNSVPSLKDSSSTRNFATYFAGQIRTIKSLRPNAAIIVIGPSDMSRLRGGVYATYPLLPYLVEQMKLKSLESGAAFWDLFGAMGGKNSMPAWVNKGLAGRDYIHFSNSGASFASQLFYDALIAEYVNWNNGGE